MNQTIVKKGLGIVGTGFVADLYMRSLQSYSDITVVAAFDENPASLKRFCDYWRVPPAASLEALLELSSSDVPLILNLTNPRSHYAVSLAALEKGKHVYSEKPLALTMPEAVQLADVAKQKGLALSAGPCSVLSEAAQTLWCAQRNEVAGKIRLVYAELDDGFIPQAPYRRWQSESGAPWPYLDEFKVGCTVEHAGYYLTWLIAMFGPVKSVAASSHNLVTSELFPGQAVAPDFSCAVLHFHSGVVARLTCSILGKHDHKIRLIGDKGQLELDECWNNQSKVRFRRRMTVRRRLIHLPVAKVLRLRSGGQVKVKRFGSASMNFALGPVEILNALNEQRPCRLSTELALHVNEVTLAIHNAGIGGSVQQMKTRCTPLEPQEWATALR